MFQESWTSRRRSKVPSGPGSGDSFRTEGKNVEESPGPRTQDPTLSDFPLDHDVTRPSPDNPVAVGSSGPKWVRNRHITFRTSKWRDSESKGEEGWNERDKDDFDLTIIIVEEVPNKLLK